MKLFRSFSRELVLLSRSYYFYIEIAMAILYLVLLLLVMPENINVKSTEYYYFDMPQTIFEQLESQIFPDDGTIKKENVTLKSRGKNVDVIYYSTYLKDIYVVNSEEILESLSKDSGNIGLKISFEDSSLTYYYYLQGYETPKFKNLAKLISSSDVIQMTDNAEKQTVKILEGDVMPLTDRQSLLSILLTVNSVLMGILIMAAYIFEDKKTNMINAIRVTPTSVGNYLIAKMGTVLLTSILSVMVVSIPIMRGNGDYLLLAGIILSASFFTITVGTLLASFFKDMESAFAAVFIVLIVLLIPAVGNMLPAWNAPWIKFIPSYWVIEGTQNALMKTANGDTLIYCAGFLLGGFFVFWLSLYRYKNKEASGI